jgi:cell wall-associated NlpC family hydrolase
LACAIALAAAGAVATSPRAADAVDYPGLADIAAAKAAVSDAAATVAELDAAVAQLEKARADAQNAALLAADVYLEAKEVAERAQRQSVDASSRADDAALALDDARGDLGAVAMEAYRSGGSFTSIEAILDADGFDDVVARSEDYTRAAAEVDSVVQQVRATEVVADTMSDFAADAAVQAIDAADAAAEALSKAEDAQRVAEQAVADALATHEEALARLAQLQNTSVQLEQERQAGLAAARAQRDRESLAEAVANAPQPPNPGSSGGTTNPPATTPPATDPPATTPPPAEPTGSGTTSASQGQAAVNHAMTLVGSPYQLGGEGPAYDCSGLTKVSWGSQGVYLPHSSRSQYAYVDKVPLAQMRPGDLVFYGTNRDPNQMFHVAIYIGNGMVMEAKTYGSTAGTRAYNSSWGASSLMPYAGRP